MLSEAIEVLISMDTTGSMFPCLTQVRREVAIMVKQLFLDIPNIRIGIIAHGDYCDGAKCITQLPFTSDKDKICKFVQTVSATGGGDAPECYELVLHHARQFDWTASKNKVVVIIGDDIPHPPSYRENVKRLDWRNEIQLLLEMGVNVYGVQALNRRHATSFYSEIADKTGGFHLTLDQFSTVKDLIMAICYKQQSPESLENWEQAVIKAGRMNRGLDYNFAVLSGKKPKNVYKEEKTYSSTRYKTDASLVSVNPSRFQVLKVDSNCSIKDFVIENGLIFNAGRGFYEFTKAETIQHNKEIVLCHDDSGDMFAGDKAREMLGLPIGETSRTRFKPLPGYTTFVQSTSYNRKLIGGTKFLYEVDFSR